MLLMMLLGIFRNSLQSMVLNLPFLHLKATALLSEHYIELKMVYLLMKERNQSIIKKLKINNLLTLFCLLELTDDFSLDRKSTRLNSSHVSISYAVFCLKKKTKHITITLAV